MRLQGLLFNCINLYENVSKQVAIFMLRCAPPGNGGLAGCIADWSPEKQPESKSAGRIEYLKTNDDYLTRI